MPGTGSVLDEVRSSAFYAEDDRVSVPRIIQVEVETRTTYNVITTNEQTPTAVSTVQLFPIK